MARMRIRLVAMCKVARMPRSPPRRTQRGADCNGNTTATLGIRNHMMQEWFVFGAKKHSGFVLALRVMSRE